MAVPEGRIERFRIVGLQANVLAGDVAHQLADHRRADACLRYADIVQTSSRYTLQTPPESSRANADHSVAVPGDGDMLRSLERRPQRLRGPSVVEVVDREVRLDLDQLSIPSSDSSTRTAIPELSPGSPTR